MNYRLLFAAFLMAAFVGGCASKDGGRAAGDQPPVMEGIKDPPINSNTHFAAGQLAESRGDFNAATLQYKNALTVDKSNLQALYRLGCVYAQSKRYAESIATWKRYVTATHESAGAYSNLAFTEELAGNPIAAEADYKKGIARDPKNEPCRVNYGLMLARHGRIPEATIQLQTVLTAAEVHYNIAGVYELQHRKEQARMEYRQAITLDPTFKDARTKLDSLADTSGE